MINPINPREIGEIAIRCGDIDVMYDFYHHILGLEVMSDQRNDGIVFFKIGEGHCGHTTVLALFRHNAGRSDIHSKSEQAPETGAMPSLHHLALTVEFNEQPVIKEWLAQHNIKWNEQIFDWIGWRGIFINDPEGNTIELVAADDSLLKTNS